MCGFFGAAEVDEERGTIDGADVSFTSNAVRLGRRAKGKSPVGAPGRAWGQVEIDRRTRGVRRARVTTRTEGLARPEALPPSHRRALRKERRDEEAIELVSLPHQRRPAGVGRACGGRARNRATQTCASGVPRSLRASTRHHDWSRRAGVGRERTILRIGRGRAKTGAGAEDRRGRRAGAHLHSTPRAKNKRLENRASRDVSVRDLLSARPQHARARYPVGARVSASGHAQAGPPPGTVRGRGELARLDESTRHRGRRLGVARAPRHHGVLGGSSGRHAEAPRAASARAHGGEPRATALAAVRGADAAGEAQRRGAERPPSRSRGCCLRSLRQSRTRRGRVRGPPRAEAQDQRGGAERGRRDFGVLG